VEESEKAKPENPGVDEDVASAGDEGERAAQASPPIEQDAEPEQTTTPAPEDEVGVPDDEEMSKPE
jgi:hypothetical protein